MTFSFAAPLTEGSLDASSHADIFVGARCAACRQSRCVCNWTIKTQSTVAGSNPSPSPRSQFSDVQGAMFLLSARQRRLVTGARPGGDDGQFSQGVPALSPLWSGANQFGERSPSQMRVLRTSEHAGNPVRFSPARAGQRRKRAASAPVGSIEVA